MQGYKVLVDTRAQCPQLSSRYVGVELISISGVAMESQQLTALEAGVSLAGNEWQKHHTVTGPEATWILAIVYLRRGYLRTQKPGLGENPSAVGLLRVEEQVLITATSLHCWQNCTIWDSVVPTHEMICELETQGVISKPHSPINSPAWPVCKSSGEWKLTVDCCGLNEV